MKDDAVLQRRFWHRSGLLVATPLAAAALLLAGLVGSASAAKLVGKDGKVYACYQVKQGGGKAKGSVRLVAKSAHCRRGERKLNWGVAGPSGSQGAPGATGTPGAAGAPGAPGANATQVSELVTRVEALESTLQGVTNGALTGALTTVDGLTGQVSGLTGDLSGLTGQLGDLEGLVDGVGGRVNALCTQTDAVTDQVNAVGSSLNTLIDNLVGSLVGAVLGTQPDAPAALPPFSCPSL